MRVRTSVVATCSLKYFIFTFGIRLFFSWSFDKSNAPQEHRTAQFICYIQTHEYTHLQSTHNYDCVEIYYCMTFQAYDQVKFSSEYHMGFTDRH